MNRGYLQVHYPHSGLCVTPKVTRCQQLTKHYHSIPLLSFTVTCIAVLLLLFCNHYRTTVLLTMFFPREFQPTILITTAAPVQSYDFYITCIKLQYILNYSLSGRCTIHKNSSVQSSISIHALKMLPNTKTSTHCTYL